MLLWHPCAFAGMPSTTIADLSREVGKAARMGLTDLARQRMEVISFFLLGLLVCTGIIQRVWNGLRRDVPILPRLTYARALGIIVLWGLLFVLVLTMISGARELMTPGAWEKKGVTYRLVPQPPVEAEIAARVEAIRRLGDHLKLYSESHGGRFPTTEEFNQIAEPLRRVPTPPGGIYRYVGVNNNDGRPGLLPPVAYEPESVGPDRLVLFPDGTIEWMPASEIERVLTAGEP
jgi:hypothetical protein